VLVDHGQDAVAQLLVAPGRRGDVRAPQPRVGHRDDHRRGGDVARLVGGLEVDRPRGWPVVVEREAAVVVHLHGIVVGRELGARLDHPADLGLVVHGHRFDGAGHLQARRGAVDGEVPVELRVVQQRPRHRQGHFVGPLDRRRGRDPEHGVVLDRGGLDHLPVVAEGGLGRGLGVGEHDRDRELRRLLRGDDIAVDDAGLGEVDPGAAVGEEPDQRHGPQRHEGGEHRAGLDVALALAEHRGPLVATVLEVEGRGLELQPPAAGRLGLDGERRELGGLQVLRALAPAATGSTP
jgi:hypothetical protein